MMQQEPQRFEQEVPDELKQAHQMTLQSGQPVRAVNIGSHIEEQTKTIRNQPSVEI